VVHLLAQAAHLPFVAEFSWRACFLGTQNLGFQKANVLHELTLLECMAAEEAS
jgi:hypothetical protein